MWRKSPVRLSSKPTSISTLRRALLFTALAVGVGVFATDTPSDDKDTPSENGMSTALPPTAVELRVDNSIGLGWVFHGWPEEGPHARLRSALLRGKYGDAVGIVENLHEEDKNDPLVLTAYGLMYDRGYGLVPNPELANVYWRQATDLADSSAAAARVAPSAAFLLGVNYLLGRGTARKEVAAGLQHVYRAASFALPDDKALPEAIHLIATEFFTGGYSNWGAEQHRRADSRRIMTAKTVALEYWSRAYRLLSDRIEENENDTRSMHIMGQILQRNVLDASALSPAISPGPKGRNYIDQAFNAYLTASETFAPSGWAAAKLIEKCAATLFGKRTWGNDRTDLAARYTELVRSSAEKGYPAAIGEIAKIELKEDRENREEALRSLRVASRFGEPASMYRLGRAMLDQPDTVGEVAQGVAWVSLAAAVNLGENKEADEEEGKHSLRVIASDIYRDWMESAPPGVLFSSDGIAQAFEPVPMPLHLWTIQTNFAVARNQWLSVIGPGGEIAEGDCRDFVAHRFGLPEN